MKNKINKFIHSKYLLISLIVLLILLVMATGTYAWFTWRSTNNTSLTMNIGKLADVTFNSGNDISTTSLAPVFNYTDGEKTTFSINNKDTTGASLDYNIKLNITSIASELKSSDLKYVLLKDNTIVKEGDFSTMVVGTNTIYSDSISSSGTINFTFYLYIDGNSENNLNMINKSLVGSIVVEAQETSFEIFADYIENTLYNNDNYETITNNGIDYEYNTVNSLMYDNYGSIRYYGANPNNYVYFNCDDYSNQSASTCEIWRILGSFFTPSGGYQVRIIRNNVINNFKWDSLANEGGWPDAGLHHALNYDYINKNSGACSFASTQTCDFSSTGLKNDATRNAISDFEWLINPITTELISAYPNDIYENEINSGTTTWTGRVGIMYLSDYAYATDLSKCSNVIADYSNSSCSSNNWLKSSSDEWTISNYNNNYEQIYYIGTDGSINTDNFLIEHNFRPTLYLKSEQTFQGGTGTLADPYQLVIR